MPSAIVDVPLRAGLQQKTSEPWLDPSSQASAQNIIWTVANATDKRPGYLNPSAPAWGVSTLTGGVAFLASVNGFGITDGFYVYNPSGPTDTVPACVATRRTISASPTTSLNPCATSYQGYALYVWEDAQVSAYANSTQYAIVQESTGQVVHAGLAVVGTKPRLLMVGSQACLFVETSATTISCGTFDMSAPLSTLGFGHFVSVVTDYGTDGATVGGYDVTFGSQGGTFYAALVYQRTSNLACAIFSFPSGAPTQVGATVIIAGVSGIAGVGARWDAANTNLWVAYSHVASGPTANTVHGARHGITWTGAAFTLTTTYDGVLWTSTNPFLQTSFQVGIEATSATTAMVVWSVYDNATSPTVIGWGPLGAAAVSAPVYVNGWGLSLLSKPFAVTDPSGNPHVYALCCTAGAPFMLQMTQFLVEFVSSPSDNSGAVLAASATVAPRLLIPAPGAKPVRSLYSLGTVTNAQNATAGSYSVGGGISETNDPPAAAAVIAATFDFEHPGRCCIAKLGPLTYVGGGVPSNYDGQFCPESATLYAYEAPGTWNGGPIVGVSTGGGLTNGQMYTYVILPEWRDSYGNVEYGQPSAPFTTFIPTGGGGQTGSSSGGVNIVALTKKGTPFHNGAGQSKMYLVPYRTAFINGAMTTTLFRIPPDLPGAAYINDPTAGLPQLAFLDVASDASIVVNPVLPTTDGVLEADAPSSFAAICEHNSRIYGIGDDLRTIWISTVQADGVPCTFNDGSQVEVSFLGDLTALWSQDQNIVYASATGLAYSQGGGVNITGVQNDLTTPTQIPSDVGCIDPRAWCVTPQGTVFRTRYGLALLDRALAVHSDFGDPVTKLLATYPTTTSMLLHPTRPELLVYCSNGSAGIVLVFNYRYSAWSSWTITDPDYAGGSLTAAATTSLGQLWNLNGSGRLFREKTSADVLPFFDTVAAGSTWVTSSLASAWVKPGGTLQGLGWIHGVQFSFVNQDWANFVVTMTQDYNAGSLQTETFTSAQISTFADVNATLGTTTEIGFKPKYSRCTAFQITLSDAIPVATPFETTGQGFRINAMSCELEPFAGARRLPGAQKG